MCDVSESEERPGPLKEPVLFGSSPNPQQKYPIRALAWLRLEGLIPRFGAAIFPGRYDETSIHGLRFSSCGSHALPLPRRS